MRKAGWEISMSAANNSVHAVTLLPSLVGATEHCWRMTQTSGPSTTTIVNSFPHIEWGKLTKCKVGLRCIKGLRHVWRKDVKLLIIMCMRMNFIFGTKVARAALVFLSLLLVCHFLWCAPHHFGTVLVTYVWAEVICSFDYFTTHWNALAVGYADVFHRSFIHSHGCAYVNLNDLCEQQKHWDGQTVKSNWCARFDWLEHHKSRTSDVIPRHTICISLQRCECTQF